MTYACLFILAFCLANIDLASTADKDNCKLDLVFVLDKSSSIESTPNAFKGIMLKFVKDVANLYNMRPDGMRAALVIFSQTSPDKQIKNIVWADLQFPFVNSLETFNKKIKEIDLRGETFGTKTFIDQGLKVAYERLLKPDESKAPPEDNRIRDDSKRFVILLTDGKQRGGYKNQLYTEAQKIRSLKPEVKILALGIGNDVDVEELEKITNPPHGKYIKITKFDELKDQLPFLKYLCRDCPSIPVPPHAVLKTSPCPSKVNQKCTVECEKGYRKTGGDKERTCFSTGQWSGKNITCTVITCPPIPVPPHAVLKTSPCPNKYNQKCIVECEKGYKKTGGDKERTCLSTGQWSGKTITCEVITCPPIPVPPHAVLKTSPCPRKVNKKCVVECEKGYKKTGGDKERTCLSTGQWSGKTITCEEKTCPPIPVPPNAELETSPCPRKVNQKCTVVCRKGYRETGGDKERMCLETEEWSGKNIKCEENCADSFNEAEIVFLLDSSSKANNFAYQLQVAEEIAKGYNVDGKAERRAAVISFSQEAVTHLELTANGKEFSNVLNSLTTDEKLPRIDLAMRAAFEKFFSSRSATEPKRVVFVIFDGSNDKGDVNAKNIKSYMEAMRRVGVSFVTIVMGDGGPLVEVLEQTARERVYANEFADDPGAAALKAEKISCQNKPPGQCNVGCKVLPSYAARECGLKLC